MSLPSPTPSTTVSGLHGSVRLADWGVIRVHGADATSFLQGQLTQDVAALAVGQAKLAGYCSPKGRLLATFIAWRVDAETILLACSTDLLAAMVKRLSMFVMRAKAKLSDASGEFTLHGVVGGLAGAGADTAMSESDGRSDDAVWSVVVDGSMQIIRLPDAAGMVRHLVCAPADAALPAVPALPADAWAWLDVQSAIPRIVAATADQFVPQMVNFESLAGVDFRKGCYPGQEVVARSQYRGTLKRRSFLFEGSGPATAGQEIFHSDDASQPAGMVVNAATYDGRHAVLAEVKLALLESGSLHLGAVDGPLLTMADLPYVLLAEAA